MSRETSMRRRVVEALRPLDAIAVENPAHPGTPDVNYVGGWIELKSADRWPARRETPLRLDHFTNVQRIWIRRRARHGGLVHVLLRVGQEWLLFSAEVAAANLGEATRDALYECAARTWPRTPTDRELLECFSPRRPETPPLVPT